jgi:hypothetical protein
MWCTSKCSFAHTRLIVLTFSRRALPHGAVVAAARIPISCTVTEFTSTRSVVVMHAYFELAAGLRRVTGVCRERQASTYLKIGCMTRSLRLSCSTTASIILFRRMCGRAWAATAFRLGKHQVQRSVRRPGTEQFLTCPTHQEPIRPIVLATCGLRRTEGKNALSNSKATSCWRRATKVAARIIGTSRLRAPATRAGPTIYIGTRAQQMVNYPLLFPPYTGHNVQDT